MKTTRRKTFGLLALIMMTAWVVVSCQEEPQPGQGDESGRSQPVKLEVGGPGREDDQPIQSNFGENGGGKEGAKTQATKKLTKRGVDFEESSLNSIENNRHKSPEKEGQDHQAKLIARVRNKLNLKGYINPKLSVKTPAGGERGIFAEEDVQKDEILGKVHLSDIIIQSQARPSCEEELKSIRDDLYYYSRIKFIIFLYEEMEKGESSKWSCDFKTLPKSYSNIGILLDSKKYERYLRNTSFSQIIADEKHFILKEFKRVQGLGINHLFGLTEQRFLEIYCLINSRIFGVTIKGQYERALVPYLDFINHESKVWKNFWSFDNKTDSFVLKSNQAQNKGDEITINYGNSKSNFKMLELYGFVVENHQKRIRVNFVEGLTQSDDLYEAKLKLFPSLKGEKSSYSIDNLFTSSEFFGYLSFLRFKLIEKEENLKKVEAKKEKLNNRTISVYRLKPLSRANELKVLDYFQRAAKARQARYNTTLEQDQSSLEEGDYIDINEKSILTVRIEERLMLQEVLLFCEDMKGLFEDRVEKSEEEIKQVLKQEGFKKYTKYFKGIQIAKFLFEN